MPLVQQPLGVGPALVGRGLLAVEEDDLDAGVRGDVGDARAHHAGAEDADPADGRVRHVGTVRALLQLLLVDEERADHRLGGGVHQDVGEPARLDLQSRVEGHERALVDRREERLGGRIDAFGLAVHHRGGADERHEARGVVGRAARHLVALLVPGLDDAGGRLDPLDGCRERVLDHLVDQAGGLRALGVAQLALEQEGRGGHGAHLARQPRGAAHAGEDADQDLGQADLGLGIVGAEDAVAGEGDLQPDAERGAGQGGGDGLASLVRLGLHARALDLPQDGVGAHQAVEEAAGGVVAGLLLHAGDDVEVHAAGEAVGLAGGDDGALMASSASTRSMQASSSSQPARLRTFMDLPGTSQVMIGDAVVAGGHGEVGHVVSPVGRAGRAPTPIPSPWRGRGAAYGFGFPSWRVASRIASRTPSVFSMTSWFQNRRTR